MGSFLYNDKENQSGLTLSMVAAEQLLLFLKDMHFEHYMARYAQPQFRRVPRNTIKCYMEHAYAKKKMNLISNFYDFKGIISVTFDCWTGTNNMGIFV